jgi:hypothetical protein
MLVTSTDPGAVLRGGTLFVSTPTSTRPQLLAHPVTRSSIPGPALRAPRPPFALGAWGCKGAQDRKRMLSKMVKCFRSRWIPTSTTSTWTTSATAIVGPTHHGDLRPLPTAGWSAAADHDRLNQRRQLSCASMSVIVEGVALGRPPRPGACRASETGHGLVLAFAPAAPQVLSPHPVGTSPKESAVQEPALSFFVSRSK